MHSKDLVMTVGRGDLSDSAFSSLQVSAMSLETLKVTHFPGMTNRYSNPTRQSSPWKPSSRW